MAPIAAGSGCADLPSIDLGVCGNGVIETEGGEDCDALVQSGKTRCAAPGERNQCRFTCAEQSDGGRPKCPSGMSCGADETCRAPSGAYAETGTTLTSTPRELLTGDVDGDGRDDLLSFTDDAVTVDYFDGSSALESALEMPSNSRDGESPIVGELTGDDLDDIVLPVGYGVVVMIGTRERTLRPTAHPAITISGVQELALAPGNADPGDPRNVLVADLAKDFGARNTAPHGAS